jgi:hypothetical protein
MHFLAALALLLTLVLGAPQNLGVRNFGDFGAYNPGDITIKAANTSGNGW